MAVPFKIDLNGKTAVVTGAGGVLCSGFARSLSECGAKVALLNRSIESVQKHAAEINAQGGTAKAYQVDVLDRKAMDETARQVIEDFGSCDILINGVGGNNPLATTDKEYYETGDLEAGIKNFFNLDQSGMDLIFDINFMGTLIPTQSFARYMLDNNGVIINISSMNSFTPLTKIPAYSAAKAAVSNFTQWLAVHFSKVGIRVNAIAPGFFVSNQNRKMLYGDDGTPTPRTGKILAATPMGRFGAADELTGTLLYLASNEASGFVTGIVIPVDGGFSAYSGV